MDYDCYADTLQEDPSTTFRRVATSLSPAEIYSKLTQKVYGQNCALKKVSILISSWLRAVSDGFEARKYNFIITGSTASGKTTTVQALKKILAPIPVKVIDSSILTGASFKGVSVNSIFDDSFTSFAGASVVVLDELDKMLAPRYTSYGENISIDVQNQFLKIFDGETLDEKTSETISTARTLFIGLGAFEGVLESFEEKRGERRKSIGFVQEEAQDTELASDAYKELSLDLVAEYGGCIQFIGRFLHIINFDKPSESVYRRLIFDVVCEVRSLYEDIPIDFLSDEDESYILAQARSGRFGIRGLRSLIWDVVLERYMGSIMEKSIDSYFYKKRREEKSRYGRIPM
jgi:ATP-dependent protease Clp ATPase subunit